MCGMGDLQACEVMYPYEMARSGMSGNNQVSGGSPADLQYRKIAPYPQAHTTRIRSACPRSTRLAVDCAGRRP